MFQRHVTQQLSAYCHQELSAAETARVEQHLEQCQQCRRAHEEIRIGVELANHLKLQTAPDSLWEELVSALDQEPAMPCGSSTVPEHCWSGRRPHWAMVAVGLPMLIAVIGGSWYYWRSTRPSWEVARLEGAPKVGWSAIAETGRLAVGDWLETDHNSRALINVGDIGEVEIDPNTRVRLLRARETEHRLRLARGKLHATIWAPPRYFIVDTPSAVATDLGCTYTLEVDEAGIGRLHVTSGWVAFELKGRESFVPADAVCETRPGIGPGTPHCEDASSSLIEALNRFDFHDGGSLALEIVLAQARKEDAFTLWHLLSRVGSAERRHVFDRLSSLVPAPDGVTRAGILQLNRAMLDVWWDALGLDDASWWRIWKGPFPESPQ